MSAREAGLHEASRRHESALPIRPLEIDENGIVAELPIRIELTPEALLMFSEARLTFTTPAGTLVYRVIAWDAEQPAVFMADLIEWRKA